MPSPFPGMNPCLEHDFLWADFHNSFLINAKQYLAMRLDPKYIISADSRIIYHELSGAERAVGIPDLGIATRERIHAGVGVAVAATAPLLLEFPAVMLERKVYLEIRELESNELVTVIQVLNPSDKREPDRQAYFNERNAVVSRRLANWVEIDLFRAGQRPEPPVIPPCDYYALVARYNGPTIAEVWPIGLRDPLPLLPIPLLPTDLDITLDLKFILDQTYDLGQFARRIYRGKPLPPLRPDDVAWIDAIVAGIGK